MTSVDQTSLGYHNTAIMRPIFIIINAIITYYARKTMCKNTNMSASTKIEYLLTLHGYDDS